MKLFIENIKNIPQSTDLLAKKFDFNVSAKMVVNLYKYIVRKC